MSGLWFKCQNCGSNVGIVVQSYKCRLERWSIINGDGMAMVVFLQRWNVQGFENFSPSPLIVFGGINHWQQWFFNVFFPILGTNGSRWLQTMVTNCAQLKQRQKCKLKIYFTEYLIVLISLGFVLAQLILYNSRTNILLRRGGIWNLAQTPRKIFQTPRKNLKSHEAKPSSVIYKLSLVYLISSSARYKGRKFIIMAKNQRFLR